MDRLRESKETLSLQMTNHPARKLHHDAGLNSSRYQIELKCNRLICDPIAAQEFFMLSGRNSGFQCFTAVGGCSGALQMSMRSISSERSTSRRLRSCFHRYVGHSQS